MVKLAVAAALVASCAPRPRAPLASHASPRDEIVLYRDVAIVRARVDVAVGAPDTAATASLAIPAGTDAEQVAVLDAGGAHVRSVQIVPPDPAKRADEDLAIRAGQLAIVADAPHAGHFAITVAYTTDRLTWDAAYTMTTTAARTRAQLAGALAIRNLTGVTWHGALLRVVDEALGAWRTRAAEKLAAGLVGATPSTTPLAKPRTLGPIDLDDGETRLDLVPAAPPRPMRSVLVYDPIGTKLDRASTEPEREPTFGVRPPAKTTLAESFEIDRDEATTAGLPRGPVRLLEQRADGSLVVLGEAKLFEPGTRAAAFDTIAVGTADGVTAHRERRELTIDNDNHRLVEEFAIAIDNARARPVDVLLREHLYRGINWHLPYPLPPIAAQEGAQQIALRLAVPAHGRATQTYVVVYTWGP